MADYSHDRRFDPPDSDAKGRASRARRVRLVLALIVASALIAWDWTRMAPRRPLVAMMAIVVTLAVGVVEYLTHDPNVGRQIDGKGPYSDPSNITR